MKRMSPGAAGGLLAFVLGVGLAVASAPAGAHPPPKHYGPPYGLDYVEQDQFHPADHAQMLDWAGLPPEKEWRNWTEADTARLVEVHGLPPELVPVAYCESRHRPWAINRRNPNGTSDWGLFQINSNWVRRWGPGWMRELELKTYSTRISTPTPPPTFTGRRACGRGCAGGRSSNPRLPAQVSRRRDNLRPPPSAPCRLSKRE